MTEPTHSRFANRAAVETIDLGPCRCPGTPDERDSAVVRTEIGAGELRSAYASAVRGVTGAEPIFDEAAGDDAAIARFTVSWTLLGDDGKPALITPAQVSLLDAGTRDALLAPINTAIDALPAAPLPNGSGAPSRASSRGSASRTRKTRTS